MTHLPPFSVLTANYPAKSKIPTKQLLDSIGGQVRHRLDDNINTCALRMSACLNASGASLVHVGGLYTLSGAHPPSSPHTPPRPVPRFIVRVHDMKVYLERNFGPGALIYDARTAPGKINLQGRKHVQGIIVFEWLDDPHLFGATGHVDLFRVVDQGPNMKPQFVHACSGECFWQIDPGPMIARLWETRP